MFSTKLKHITNSVVILMATLFFSCTNDINEVRDFLADKNLPIGVAKNINLVYKEAGLVTTKMKSPLLYDYSNRKKHPYSEFPKGIYISKISNKTDSTTVSGKYAITYTNTEVSELKDSVVVINYAKNYTLRTSQLFWDQKEHYFVTEKKFSLITPSDTIYGTGFESSENIENWHAKNNSGSLKVHEQK